MLKLSFLISKDGSHTLVREDLNETYHSHNGAIQESLYVFIDKGLNYLLDKHTTKAIKILEVGFGTGLNALLAYQFAKENNVNIHYTSLEPYPVPIETAKQLNYTDFVSVGADIFNLFHHATWNEEVMIDDVFVLQKIDKRLEDVNLKENNYDVVFYDAFAPSKQAEVWEMSNLQKVFDATSSGGNLVTYCAQGQFKRNLKSVGYDIETLDGAPPKREMVRANKP